MCNFFYGCHDLIAKCPAKSKKMLFYNYTHKTYLLKNLQMELYDRICFKIIQLCGWGWEGINKRRMATC